MKNIPLFEAIATLIGTIIGAGILGVPFVFHLAGFWTGTLILALVGLAMILMKLFLGEAALRTYGNHQLPGYAEIYLGRFFKYLLSLSLIFGIYGALLAYFIGEGEVIATLTGITPFWGSLGFYLIFSLLVYFGMNIIKKTELFLSAFLLIAVLLIAFLSFSQINLANLAGFDLTKFFIPYGVILFACSGLVAVPEVRQQLLHRENLVKPAIIWGCMIPPLIYFLFALLVIGVCGANVSEVATVGLGSMLGWKMVLVANIFAFFAMATSFLTLGLALKQTFQFDNRLSHFLSWLLVVSVPLAIFLIGARDFVQVIEVAGALGVGISGIVNILIYFSARRLGKRKPEYAFPTFFGKLSGLLLIALFALGILYTLMHL